MPRPISTGKAAIPTVANVCAAGQVDYAAVIRYADVIADGAETPLGESATQER